MTELADFELPTALSLGLSYDFRLDKTNNLMLHGTFQNNSFATDDYNFGLEYNYNKLIYLRGGYQITNDTQDDRLFTVRALEQDLTITPAQVSISGLTMHTESLINLTLISSLLFF
ncbi:MAG: hypothetical protein IPM96_05260 [Ignavibacteria bacterium]|nr:hypothetical protein [Ignavibacteria bacterium]